MTDIDLDKIREHLFNLTKELLSGKEVKKVRVRVSVEVPEILYDAICDISEQLNMEVGPTFEKLATEGLMERLRSMTQGQHQQTNPQPQNTSNLAGAENTLKDMGVDLGNLTQGIDKLKMFAGHLQALEGVLNNAASTTKTNVPGSKRSDNKQRDTRTSKKNSKKPDVPDGN